MQRLAQARIFLSLFIGAAFLGACGGGGGGTPAPMSPPPPVLPPPPPSPPPPPPPMGSIPSGTEFAANWGVDYVNAEAAWSRGYTGDGIVIGVIDDGIHPTHPELAGRVDTVNSVDIVPGRNQLTTDNSHGSELSSLMVGNFNGSQTVGIAYGATVLAIRADDGTGGFFYDDLANAIDYAVAHGVDIINFSLGGPNAPDTGSGFQTALAAATAAGVIVVVSAGNDGGSATQVNYPGFYATNPAVSNGLIVVAGGLNPNGTINTISNPPGSAANWYLVAPGWEVIVPDYGPPGPVPLFQVCGAAAGLPSGLCEIQGTSYASPQIAAGLALLMEAAPGLTPQQIVDLAFTSAVDRGAAGTDSVFGRGQFDIARAFAPVGPLAFETASGAAAPADAPVGTVGAAYGDAFANTEAWRATAFDSFDRSFDVSLAHGWIGAAQASIADQAAPALWRQGETHGALSAHFTTPDDVGPDAVRRRMLEEPEGAFRAFAALSDDVTLTVARNAQALDFDLDAAATGHLGFAGAEFAVAIERQLGGGALTFASQTGEADLGLFGPSRRRGWAMRYADALGPVRFDATYGVLTEEGALLGLVWDDAWGAAANGITEFIGLGANWSPRPDWETSASIEFGRARLDGGSWLTLDAPLLTSAARAAVRWRVTPSLLAEEGIGGAWTLSVSQPLRIESGAFSALLPVSDAWGRQHLAFDRRSIGASPSGREIETRLSYWLWSGGVLSAHADLAHRSEPGHRADADDAVEALIGLRLAH